MSEVKCPQRRLLAVFIEPCITFILPPSLERATVRVNSARLKSMRHHVWRMWGWILPPHASSMADHCHIWESGRRYHCQWLFTCLSVKCILFFWPCAEQINLLRSRGQQWILHAWIPPWIKFNILCLDLFTSCTEPLTSQPTVPTIQLNPECCILGGVGQYNSRAHYAVRMFDIFTWSS